jgi:translation initiation factor IF-2
MNILQIIPGNVFNANVDGTIVVGVNIIEGQFSVGSKLNTVNKSGNIIELGVITGIEKNRRNLQIANRTERVSIKIKTEMRIGVDFDEQSFIKS